MRFGGRAQQKLLFDGAAAEAGSPPAVYVSTGAPQWMRIGIVIGIGI